MSNATSQNQMTRRQKKDTARLAVRRALQLLDGQLKARQESTLYEKLLEVIVENSLTPSPIDKRDVQRALRWLHDKGYVRVSHRDRRTDEKIHRVRLLRTL